MRAPMTQPAPAPRLFGKGAPPRKIAVFRALQLGDMLCAIPALRALRAAAPLSHVTLVGLPWATAFVKRFGMYIDDLLVFPGFPAFPEQPAHLHAVPHFLAEMQRRRFDLALQMHGDGNLTNPLLVLFAAEHCAGFYLPGHYCPSPDTFLPWQAQENEVRRYLRLVAALGVAAQGEHLEFPLADADYRALQRSDLNIPAPGTYVCLHPGARLPSRRWLPQRFAEVADRIAASGMRIVLTGTAAESGDAAEVQRAMRMPALNLCGKTELGTLAALIAQASLVVSNDTDISHLAAAVATPSVVVACGSDPVRWAPPDQGRHQAIGADLPCRPCTHAVCPTGHECAEQISAEAVALLAARILRNWDRL